MKNGIDYGMGQTNIDKETGIRFGVIPANDVGESWYEDSEAEYGEPHCPKCGNEADRAGTYEDTEEWERAKYECEDFECPICKYVFGSESAYGDEPLFWFYKRHGYVCNQGLDGDIFITRSPYFTYAPFCSPCAPGACYLPSASGNEEDGAKAYCFGHDWFSEGKSSYPVYNVETGELVLPE
jgi:hypothetical protein